MALLAELAGAEVDEMAEACTLREGKGGEVPGENAKNTMSQASEAAKAKRKVGRLPTHPTPASRTGTSGTALEHIFP